MTHSFWLNLLGSGGIVTLILAVGKFIQNRWDNRASKRRDSEADEATWNALYRSRAEAHLSWDQDRRADILELRQVVNELLVAAGKPRRDFTPIPPAPSLFPIRGEQIPGTSTNPYPGQGAP